MKNLQRFLFLATLWSVAANAQTFEDVPSDYWAYSFIETVAANGITAGCGNGNYCPVETVSRAQMAVFLERGMRGGDYVPPSATGNVFLDVGAGDFAANFIEQLYSDGITAGCGSNNYCPSANVSRAQMAVFLLRARNGAGYSPPAATGVFDDVDLSYWAAAWIEALAADGITAGCGNNNYCPEESVTRAQMAVFLVRTFGYEIETPDIVPPSMPAAPSVTAISATQVSVSWAPGADNVGVTAYNVYRDNALLASSTELSLADTGLAEATEYCYQISALDEAGNESGLSSSVCATTFVSTDFSLILARQVDTSTQIPGTAETFTSFQEVKLTNDGFVFRTGGATSLASSDSTGVYEYSNGLTTLVADLSTTRPDSGGSFSSFSNLQSDGGQTYFLANRDFGFGWSGIYVDTPAGLQTVVDTSTDVPGRVQPWTGFFLVEARDSVVSFTATDAFSAFYGFYQILNSGIELVSDSTDIVFGSPISAAPGKVYYIHQENISLFDNGSVTPVANRELLWPGQYDDSVSLSFNYLGLDSLEPSFHTTLRTPTGYEYVHRATQTGIETLVDALEGVTEDPDSENIGPISNPIVQNGAVLMEAYETNWNPGYRRGVMFKRNGVLKRVVMTQQPLDGVEVAYVWVNDFDGTRFALVVEFIDGSQAIYTGSVVLN